MSAGGSTTPQTAAGALQALYVLASPSDLPRYDADRLWADIQEALAPFQKRGAVRFERLRDATESALKARLAQEKWSILHLVVHGQERSSAHYGTIALQASDGNSRKVTAAYLANLLGSASSLRLVILQAWNNEASFDIAARELLQRGIPVVATAPPLSGKVGQIFIAKLFAAALMGSTVEEVAKEFQAALGTSAPRLISRDATQPILPASAAATSPVVIVAPSETAEAVWHDELRRKRAAGQFDVFLCHNGADKPEVKRIAQQLKEAGILPWLDVWELPPGQPWQPLLEQQIGTIRSAAVCFGSAGIGPWQEREMYALLSEFVERGVPVIPLLLPDAPLVPELPRFLRGMTWVDFRCDDPNPLHQLIWGITGKRPED